jgi:hypothetical protein
MGATAKDLQGKNLREWYEDRDEDDPTFVSPTRPPKSSSTPSKSDRRGVCGRHVPPTA